MSTQIQGPDHHFSAFYNDNSLLIQFMVVEFIHTVQLTLQLKNLVLNPLDGKQHSENLFPTLKQIFGQLIEFHPQHEQTSYSRWTKGSLTKLKEYCEHFSRNSHHENKQHILLHMASHQSLLSAIHIKELLNSLSINPYTQNPEAILHLTPVKRTLNALQKRINQVIRCLPPVVRPYWNNENVILCLMRFQPHLAEIYGADFLSRCFKWPPAKELEKFLLQRYKNRGFETLFSNFYQILNSNRVTHERH